MCVRRELDSKRQAGGRRSPDEPCAVDDEDR